MRCFYAVEPNAEALAFLESQQVACQQLYWAHKVRWTKPGEMHMTLKFLGDGVANSDVPGLIEVMRTVAVNHPRRFSCVLHQASFFPNPLHPRVVVCRVARNPTLMGWVRMIEEQTVRLGVPAERKDFSGHITLGKCTEGFSDRASVEPGLVSMTLWVGRIGLFQSELTNGGAVYSELGHVELTA